MLRHRRIYILPTRRGAAFIATHPDHAGHVAQLRAVARLHGDVPALRAGRRGAAAHVSATSRAWRFARLPPAKPLPATRCRSRFRSRAAARTRTAIALATRDGAAVDGRHSRRRRAAGDGRRACAATRPPSARPGDAVLRLSARPVARLGLRPFSARRHRVPGAGARCAAAAARRRGRRCRRDGAGRHGRSRRPARLPGRRSDAAHRLEGGRARRRLAHQAVRGRVAAARSTCPGRRCRRHSMPRPSSRGSPPGCSPPNAWRARSRCRCRERCCR